MKFEIDGELHYQIEMGDSPVIRKIITCKSQSDLVEQLEIIKKEFGEENFEKCINKEIKIYAIGKIKLEKTIDK